MLQDKYNRNKGPVRRRSLWRQRGFTLIEVLAALTVISVAMTPVFVQVNAVFRISRVIKENLTATMLAQEGVELVRGVRDGNWFRGDPFEQSLDSCAAGCHMDYDDVGLTVGVSPPIKLDVLGRFQYDGGADTIYARTITIERIDVDPSPTHYKVTSEVTWDSRGTARNLIVEDHVFNWLNP